MQRKRMTKERITALCKDLNENKCTNIADFLGHHKMGRAIYVQLEKAGIIWNKDGYWKGLERIHDDRFLKYKKLHSSYYAHYNKINYPKKPSQPTLFTKTKVKVEPKKEVKIQPKKVVSRRKPTLGIIQRFKVLFTGKI
jgi:hypothetical protein